MRNTRGIRGLTLIELIVAIAVVAILITLGTPSLIELIRNNRIASQNNELVAMLSFAKSEAVRRNREITTVLSSTTGDWSGFVQDPDGEGEDPCQDQGALRCTANENVTLEGTGDPILFDNRGYLELDGEWQSRTLYLQHVPCNGERQRRRIDILPTGQITSCSLQCDSEQECT